MKLLRFLWRYFWYYRHDVYVSQGWIKELDRVDRDSI